MSCMSCRAEGSVPYLIPVGGSNALGAWGYIEAFREMVDQVSLIPNHWERVLGMKAKQLYLFAGCPGTL